MILHLVPIYKIYSETFIWNHINFFSVDIESKVICSKLTTSASDNTIVIQGKDSNVVSKINYKMRLKLGKANFFNYHVLKKEIKKLAPKIIHAHFGYFIEDFISISNDFNNINLVISFHGTDLNSIIKRSNSLRISLGKIANNVNITCVFPSVFLKNSFVDLVGNRIDCKIKIVENSVNPKFINAWKANKTTTNNSVKLLSVGRLAKVKGICYVIQALPHLKKQYKDVKYTVIGDGDELRALKSLTKKLNVQDNVDFVGRCDVNRIIHFLNKSDIFIQPSIKLSNGQEESFGVAALEAGVSGIPMIVTNSGGLPEVINQEDFFHHVINQQDSNAIVDAVNNIKTKVSPKKNIDTDSYIRKFEMDIISKKWKDIYELK